MTTLPHNEIGIESGKSMARQRLQWDALRQKLQDELQKRLRSGKSRERPFSGKLLALEWERDRLYGVEANVSESGIRFERAFHLPRPEASETDAAEPTGDWLRAQLRSRGVTATQVVVTLPREALVVKRLELPAVGDDELAQLVLFQAEAKSAVPLSELHIDFLPLPGRPGATGREVLMVTVPRAVVSRVRSEVESAGLTLAAVGINPVAKAELAVLAEAAANARDGADAAALIVSCTGQRVEVAVVQQRQLLFTHSARLPAGEAQQQGAILAEVSRALVAAGSVLSQQAPGHCWIVAAANCQERIITALAAKLNCPVVALEPAELAGLPTQEETAIEPAALAAAVGAILSRGAKQIPAIDFLAPREPVVVPDRRRLKIGLAAGACAAVVLAFWVGFSSYLKGIDREIEDLALEDRELDAFLKQSEPLMTSTAQVREWADGSLPWLDELLTFAGWMPSTDRIYLTSMRLDPQSTGSSGRLKFEGFARERDDVMKLSELLVRKSPRYRIRSHPIASSSSDAYYPWRFEMEVFVNPSEPIGDAEKPANAVEGQSAPGGQTAAGAPRTAPAEGGRS